MGKRSCISRFVSDLYHLEDILLFIGSSVIPLAIHFVDLPVLPALVLDPLIAHPPDHGILM